MSQVPGLRGWENIATQSNVIKIITSTINAPNTKIGALSLPDRLAPKMAIISMKEGIKADIQLIIFMLLPRECLGLQ